jgi:hypothetical protein
LETPFIDLQPTDLRDIVVNHKHRPERPEEEDIVDGGGTRLIADDLWALIEVCWDHEPKYRPSANVTCERLSHMMEMRSSAAQIPKTYTQLVVSVPRPEESTVTLTPTPRLPSPKWAGWLRSTDPWEFQGDLQAALLIESGREAEGELLLLHLVSLRERSLSRKDSVAARFAMPLLEILYWKQSRFDKIGEFGKLIPKPARATDGEMREIEVCSSLIGNCLETTK